MANDTRRQAPVSVSIIPTGAGGWVYALGTGTLSQRTSTLHRRDRLEIIRDGTYVSVDTGKYSTGPWLAKQLADEIIPE